MKLRTLVLLLTGLLYGSLALGAPATGSLEGRVLNATNSNALAKARVTLEGTQQEVMTDESGVYRFSAVPAGSARVSVSYLGMQPESATVAVPAGGSASLDFKLSLANRSEEVTKLEAFEVAASRTMSALAVAMNEQRFAPNLKNVVTIDQFGDRGQENIGNMLLFIPGVSIGYSGIHPFDVSVRGLPSNTTGLTIDGADVATTRDERSPNLRAVPMANVSRVEVTKVPMPDAWANGLGGSVNLISKTGLDASRPVFSYQANFLFHESDGITLKAVRNHIPLNSAKWKQPSFDLNYSAPINKNLAFTVGLARSWRQTPRVNDSDRIPTWDLVRGVMLSEGLNSLAQLNTTLSGQLGVDWRIAPTDTLSLSASSRSYKLPITRSLLNVSFGAGVTGDATFAQGASTAVGFVQQGQNWRVEGYRTNQLSARYQHRGTDWKIDALASWSKSGEYQKDMEEGMFRNVNSSINGLVIRGSDSDGWIFRKLSAVDQTGASVDIYNGALYSIPSGQSNPLQRWGGAANGRIDVTREFGGSVPFSIKTGIAASRKSYDLRTSLITWNFRPNGAADVTSRLAGNFDVFDKDLTGVMKYGVPYKELSLRKVYDLYQKNPSWFVLDEAAQYQSQVVGSRQYSELLSAAYVRSDVRLLNSKLWLVGGVRFERTEGKGSGPLDNINAQYQRDAAGKFITDANGQKVLVTTDPLQLAKLRYRERATYSDKRYSDFYPSVNAAYNVTDSLILRAAYARTIGRPNLAAITPGVTISSPDIPVPTINVSNPSLKPWTANNYDLTLESYYLKGGVGSIGVFRKDVRDFFGSIARQATPELLSQYGVQDNGTYGNYSLVTQLNSGDAKITGFEFSYKQSLTFLPHWARGLEAFVNLTKVNRNGGALADFSSFTPKSGSAGVTFARGRFLVTNTVTYRSEQVQSLRATSATVPAGTYQYLAAITRWNIYAEYAFNRSIALFYSINDVGGFANPQYLYGPNTPAYTKNLRAINEGSFSSIGIKGKF